MDSGVMVDAGGVGLDGGVVVDAGRAGWFTVTYARVPLFPIRRSNVPRTEAGPREAIQRFFIPPLGFGGGRYPDDVLLLPSPLLHLCCFMGK